MKRWPVPLLGLTLTLATAGVVTAYAMAGDGSDASAPPESALPPVSAMCVEEAPDCNDMLVADEGDAGAIEPDFSGDGPYLAPDRDVDCGPDQGISITSDGQVSCVGIHDLPDTPGEVDAQPPIRSDQGIDPNERNRIHNIDARQGENVGAPAAEASSS